MALHGNQKKFDKNNDGKLSVGEWQTWYSATYGHDIEMSERREQAQAEDDWSSQLAQSARTIRCAANSFVRAACTILPSTQPDAKNLAWRTLLCQITTALAEGNRWLIRQTISPSGMYVSGKAGYPYRVWTYDLAEISGLCSQKELEQAVRSRRALFILEGELSAERCGRFWQQVIAQLPPYDETSRPSFADGAVCSLIFAPDSDPAIERALEDLLQSLFPLAAFFAGEMDAADRRNRRFLEYFIAHWRRLRGVYVPFCDDKVEQLAEEFPQLKARWTLEKLAKMDCADLLDELYRAEPELALTIWRSLAETTEPITDPETAEQFFYRLETVLYDGEDDPELLRPLLDALGEEAFARQVFQSAFVNSFHVNLINAALVCGKYKQAEHFRELLNANPLPRGHWELSDEDLEKLFAAEETGESACAAPAAPTASLSDDGTVFHYCTVHVSGVRRPYAYLTGGLPLQVDDWVEVPFGKDDIPRRGQVSSLTICTRATAPWPPEQTKTVLRVVDAPVEVTKTLEPAITPVSKPKPMFEPAQKKTEPKAAPEPAPTSEAPPVQAPATSDEDEEMARLLEKIEAEKERKKLVPEQPEPIPVTVPKRRFPWRNASGFLAIFVCVVGIGLLVFYLWNQLHQRYEQAVTLAEAGSYTEAKAGFDALGGYRDAESLSVYCRYAELYASSATYDGGLNELSQLTLKRNSALQSDLDDLLVHVTALEEQKRLEEEHAAAEKKQAEELEAYAGKLPVEGMPYRCLSLTSLGLPDKTEKCQFYDNMDVHRRYKIHHWYNNEGQTVAYCHSHWPKDEDEEVIYAFTYYDSPIGRPNSAPPLVPPFGTSDGSDPYDIEDYITAEDFYWGNRAYFDSLDDAEAYFNNHKS